MVENEDALLNTDMHRHPGTRTSIDNTLSSTPIREATIPVIPEAYLVENPTTIDASTPVVPVAFLGEDFNENEVAIAEIALPAWQKHKRFYAVTLVMLSTIIGPVAWVVVYSHFKSSQYQSDDGFVTNERTIRSAMPSESPSSNPTMTAPYVSPALPLFQSQSSSSSTEPKCYMVHISAQHYRGNVPTWTVNRVDETVIKELSTSVPTLRPTWHASLDVEDFVDMGPVSLTSTIEDKCLQEGTYEVTIYNNPLYYYVGSNGNHIVEGLLPGYKDSTTFHVPFA